MLEINNLYDYAKGSPAKITNLISDISKGIIFYFADITKEINFELKAAIQFTLNLALSCKTSHIAISFAVELIVKFVALQ